MKQTKRLRTLAGLPDIEWSWSPNDKTLWKASREVEFVPEVLKYVTGRNLVIQAGAGCGVYPMRLAKEFSRVMTFEVFPPNIVACKENFIRADNITFIEAALGENHLKRGMVEVSAANCGAGYLDGEGDVPTVRIDDYAVEPDLIWLDIQGHEPEALRGAMETIRKCHPVIVIEEDMISYMKDWGIDEKTAGNILLAEGYKRGPCKGHDVIYTWT